MVGRLMYIFETVIFFQEISNYEPFVGHYTFAMVKQTDEPTTLC